MEKSDNKSNIKVSLIDISNALYEKANQLTKMSKNQKKMIKNLFME
jgi:hypothetical protein